jgi:hypothetical protein
MPRQGYATEGTVADPAQTAPDYRAMVAEHARQKGLPVEDALTLVAKESGFRPVLGDDGSSGGLFQMHVGGLSSKYPNPGLGDEYFNARQPELAKTFTPAQKMAYLNDPQNQHDISDYATSHIADKGAGAWTQARNYGLFGLPKAGEPTGVRAFAGDKPQGEAQKSIGAALKAGTGPEADTFLGGIKAALPTQKDASGKESTNWEKVLIPLLSGVGSALSSQRNTLGGALGEGLLGGISGYQSISKMQADIPKTEAETQQLKSESARTDLISRQLAAGLWERVPVAGVGFVLINKEDPTVQFKLTDKDFKPLPHIAGRLNDFGLTLEELAKYRKTGDLPAGTRIVDNKPAGGEQKTAETPEKSNETVEKVTDAIKPAKNFMEWTAVTEPPKNFMPPEQIPRALNKATQASDMAEGQKSSADATAAAASSYKGAITLTRLMDDYSRLPQNGPLAPGAYADARYKKLGEINMALTAMGLPAIDTGSQAASEAITKGNFALAAEMSRSIGTRVSNSIVDQAIQNNPSLKNSPLGFQLVAQSLKELQNYDQDREKYINSYFGRFQHTRTANSDFNDINKPEFYAKRAANTAMTNFLLSNPKIGSQTVDGRAAIDSLKAHIAENPKEKDAAKRRFDKTLGVNGAANMLLGEF